MTENELQELEQRRFKEKVRLAEKVLTEFVRSAIKNHEL